MADEKVRTVFEGDASSFESAVQKVKRGADDTKAAAASIGSSMTSLNSAFELAKKGAEGIGKALKFIEDNGNTRAFKEGIDSISDSLGFMKENIALSVTQSSSFQVALAGITRDIGEASEESQGLGTTLGDYLAKGIVIAQAAFVGFSQALLYGRRALAGTEELVYGVGAGFARLAGKEDLADAWIDEMRRAGDEGFVAFEQGSRDIEARAAELRRRLDEINGKQGVSLDSPRVLSKDAQKSVDEKAKAAAEAEKKIREEYAKTAAAEASMLYEARKRSAEASKDKMELINIEREQALDKARSEGVAEGQLYDLRYSFSKKFAAQYIETETERIKKVYEEEQKAHDKAMERAKKFTDEQTKSIAREFREREEAQQKITQGINNTTAIIQAGFQAGHIWAESFKKGANPDDIRRGIFSILSVGLGVAGILAGGPTNPLGAGLLAGGALTGGVASFHSGGIVRAHSGLAISPLLPGEVDIRAQTDERVLSRSQVSQLGGQEGVDRAIQAGGPGYHFTFAPVISPGVNAAEVRGILRKEMVEFQGQFALELRRTGAIRRGVR